LTVFEEGVNKLCNTGYVILAPALSYLSCKNRRASLLCESRQRKGVSTPR